MQLQEAGVVESLSFRNPNRISDARTSTLTTKERNKKHMHVYAPTLNENKEPMQIDNDSDFLMMETRTDVPQVCFASSHSH